MPSFRGFECNRDVTTVEGAPGRQQWLSAFHSAYYFGMYKAASRFFSTLTVSVLFGTVVQSSVAASENCTLNEKEHTVLSSVLNDISKHPGSVVIVESRTDSSHFASEFRLRDLLLQAEASELLPQLRSAPSGSTVSLSPVPIISEIQEHELEQDFRAKLKQPCSIPPFSNGPKPPLLRTRVEMSRMFSGNDPSKGWSRFHQVFGDDAELLTFSRVAFDTAKQYALVHVSSGISEHGGCGELYLLNWVGGNWVIKRVFQTWTT